MMSNAQSESTMYVTCAVKVINVVSLCKFFRVADLLLAGAVMNRIFQPHESHIPYTLQVNTTLPMLLFNSN